MYSKIYNPYTNNYVSINSVDGKNLLYNYIQYAGYSSKNTNLKKSINYTKNQLNSSKYIWKCFGEK